MGMLLHRQGEARRNKSSAAPSPCEVKGGTQEQTGALETGTQKNTARSGGRKPPSKPNKP